MASTKNPQVVGSILHGAYGDVYEQALCLKHYVKENPHIELRLFAASTIRLEAFSVIDFSFATCFLHWTAIESQSEIDAFFQFQVFDGELVTDVLNKLPPQTLAKFDQTQNILPWVYMRDHRLLPSLGEDALTLSAQGKNSLAELEARCGITEEMWSKPSISFLWRYRKGPGAISATGQKSEVRLRKEYSAMFGRLIQKFDAKLLVFGMNVMTTDSNRALTDNKYSAFGLEVDPEKIIYMPGLSWPLELESSTRTTICCGHPSGFTEAQWIKRGNGVILMDAPPHYVAKLLYRRMPFFELKKSALVTNLVAGFVGSGRYEKQIAEVLEKHAFRTAD